MAANVAPLFFGICAGALASSAPAVASNIVVIVAIVAIYRNSILLFRKGHHKRLGIIIQPLPHL